MDSQTLVCRVLIFSIIFASTLFADDIKDISGKFLGTPYKANSLIGSVDQKEQLVVDFSGVDCFTFIDQVEALKYKEFEKALISIRYKNSNVIYKNRNHFFSDWKIYNKNIKDITCSVGKCKTTTKYLNKKADGGVYLEGIDIIKRDISYIHLDDIDFFKLKDGDYIGIYTTIAGLDVTHVGIAIKKDAKWYLRHASSRAKKVIDSNLKEYIKNKKGILVFRSTK